MIPKFQELFMLKYDRILESVLGDNPFGKGKVVENGGGRPREAICFLRS